MSVFVLLILLISMIVYISVSRYLEKDFNHLLELRAKSIANWNIDQGKKIEPDNASDKLFHEQDFYFSTNQIFLTEYFFYKTNKCTPFSEDMC